MKANILIKIEEHYPNMGAPIKWAPGFLLRAEGDASEFYKKGKGFDNWNNVLWKLNNAVLKNKAFVSIISILLQVYGII